MKGSSELFLGDGFHVEFDATSGFESRLIFPEYFATCFTGLQEFSTFQDILRSYKLPGGWIKFSGISDSDKVKDNFEYFGTRIFELGKFLGNSFDFCTWASGQFKVGSKNFRTWRSFT